jgi:hypothetical protein
VLHKLELELLLEPCKCYDLAFQKLRDLPCKCRGRYLRNVEGIYLASKFWVLPDTWRGSYLAYVEGLTLQIWRVLPFSCLESYLASIAVPTLQVSETRFCKWYDLTLQKLRDQPCKCWGPYLAMVVGSYLASKCWKTTLHIMRSYVIVVDRHALQFLESYYWGSYFAAGSNLHYVKDPILHKMRVLPCTCWGSC